MTNFAAFKRSDYPTLEAWIVAVKDFEKELGVDHLLTNWKPGIATVYGEFIDPVKRVRDE